MLKNIHPLANWYTPEIKARNERIKKRPTALTITDLHKTFEHKGKKINVLNSIDFTAYKREFVCVVGPSGCGKSTLARLIAGLETHEVGAIHIDDELVDGPGPDRGMVFQSYSLFPWMTVKQNGNLSKFAGMMDKRN
mgnify:CR=1 FL=1